MNNILGILVSFSFITIILIITMFLSKHKWLDDEGSRKFIHIATCHWWFIAMYFFDNIWYLIIFPISFIFLNYLSYRYHLVKVIERKYDCGMGSVYYPISLLLLVLFSFGLINQPYIGLIGVLIMGYGDGFAALFGKYFGKMTIYKDKTLIGSITMFIITFLVTFIILMVYNRENLLFNVFVLSIIATLLELFSRKGFDNLTVPIATSLLYYFLII